MTTQLTTTVVMPMFYHGRLKGNSDKAWIMRQMAWVPAHEQTKIAEEYSDIFLSEKPNARKKANTWLHGIAAHYRDANKRTESLKEQANV